MAAPGGASLALTAALLCLARTAAAHSWPAKPLRLISPYAPGGTNDVTACIVAERNIKPD